MAESNPFERILVGLDDEGRARPAAECAVALAELFGARVELLHAVPVPPPLWPGVDTEKLASLHASTLVRAREVCRRQLEAVVAGESGSGAGAGPVLEVLPGHPAKVMVERAESFGADLIVLGPHARRGLIDFGGVSRAVLAQARVPVWS